MRSKDRSNSSSCSALKVVRERRCLRFNVMPGSDSMSERSQSLDDPVSKKLQKIQIRWLENVGGLGSAIAIYLNGQHVFNMTFHFFPPFQTIRDIYTHIIESLYLLKQMEENLTRKREKERKDTCAGLHFSLSLSLSLFSIISFPRETACC